MGFEILTFLGVALGLFIVIRWGFRTPPEHWYVEVPTAHQPHPREVLFKILCKPSDYGFNVLIRLVKNDKHRNRVFIDESTGSETIVFIVNDKEPLDLQLKELTEELVSLDRSLEYRSLNKIFKLLLTNHPSEWTGKKPIIISKLVQLRFLELVKLTGDTQ